MLHSPSGSRTSATGNRIIMGHIGKRVRAEGEDINYIISDSISNLLRTIFVRVWCLVCVRIAPHIPVHRHSFIHPCRYGGGGGRGRGEGRGEGGIGSFVEWVARV